MELGLKKKGSSKGGKKTRKRGSGLTKVGGIVVPIAWDESGRVTAIAISTWDEDEYVVDLTGKGKELLSHIRDEVEVIGRTKAEENRKVIVVREIFLKQGSGNATSRRTRGLPRGGFTF
jgi:hypothetical protein